MARDVIAQPVAEQTLQAPNEVQRLKGIESFGQLLDGQRNRRVVFLVPFAEFGSKLSCSAAAHERFFVTEMIEQIDQQIAQQISEISVAGTLKSHLAIAAAAPACGHPADVFETPDASEQEAMLQIDFGMARE